MHGIQSLQRNLTARFAVRLATVGVVSVALALGGLTVAAQAALAPPPPRHVWAYGQGGGVIVYADNFTPGAVVRIEVLDAGLRTVLSERYLTTPSTGAWDVLMPVSYTGDVWVAADSPAGPTVWARTHVFPDPHLDSVVAAPTQCGTVAITGSGYYPGDTVRVELLDAHLNLIDTQWLTAQAYGIYAGTIRATLDTHGFAGTAWVVTDFGAPGEAWAETSTCRT